MNAHPASTEMGRGRGNAPFPSAPSPKITLGRLHKTLDTPWKPVDLNFYALAAVSWWNIAFQFPFFLTHNELAQTTAGTFSLLQVASWLAR